MCLSAPCLLFTFLQFQFHAANAFRRKRLVKRSEQFEAMLLQIFISMEFSHHSPSNSARDIGVHNQIVENPCFPLRQTISVDIKCFTMLLGKEQLKAPFVQNCRGIAVKIKIYCKQRHNNCFSPRQPLPLGSAWLNIVSKSILSRKLLSWLVLSSSKMFADINPKVNKRFCLHASISGSSRLG